MQSWPETMEFFGTYDARQGAANFKEAMERCKVVHVTHLLEGHDAEQTCKILAQQVGIPVICEEDPVTGALHMNKWTEIRYQSESSVSSYKHSNTHQPLHTDYGYFSFELFGAFFYCVQQAAFGGATCFLDADRLAELLETADSTLFKELRTRPIQFGRQGNPLASNRDLVLQRDKAGWKINWNYFRAMNDEANRDLVEAFHSFLENTVERSGELFQLKLMLNEAVFFHDRRVLHGRNSFIGQRHLNKGALASHLPDSVSELLAPH